LPESDESADFISKWLRRPEETDDDEDVATDGEEGVKEEAKRESLINFSVQTNHLPEAS